MTKKTNTDTVAAYPSSFGEWMECLDLMKKEGTKNRDVYNALVSGSFSGTPALYGALEQEIIRTVNAVLQASVKRFLKGMNDSITFNELFQIEAYFRKLKKDTMTALFFEKTEFLSEEFRAELSAAVKKRMTAFWDDTVSYLDEQSVEASSSELEDLLFLIKRIRLFD